MSTLVDELSSRAKTLPAEDRARLAEVLLDSLQEEYLDTESGSAWDREIERRVAGIESGAKLISAEEVHAEARRLIRR